MVWSTVSKAADRSSRTRAATSPPSTAVNRSDNSVSVSNEMIDTVKQSYYSASVMRWQILLNSVIIQCQWWDDRHR